MKEINNQKGIAAVEFAIVAPLLFLVLFGIISYGIMLYNQALITNAARTGARAGIVYSVSGNGLTGFTSYPANCTPLTNTNIYGSSIDVVRTGAHATALCAANNALKAAGLIGFGATVATPTITASSGLSTSPTSACTSIGPSCLLTVRISYPYIGVYQLNNNLSARSAMNYE
jgi:Flp pilus assembly protein TadG